MTMLDNLLKMYEQGQDNVLLRFSLGNEFFKADDLANAEMHLRAALQHDPKYSAAWKILGRVLAAGGQHAVAADAYEQGIAVAEERGDIQAAKEMRVFLKRSNKALQERNSD